MYNAVRRNKFLLGKALDVGRQVRFVYNTVSDGKLIPRVGTVLELNDKHVIIADSFHQGRPRSVVIQRIVGEVEVEGIYYYKA